MIAATLVIIRRSSFKSARRRAPVALIKDVLSIKREAKATKAGVVR